MDSLDDVSLCLIRNIQSISEVNFMNQYYEETTRGGAVRFFVFGIEINREIERHYEFELL